MVLKVRVSPDLIGGSVDEGYGKVADAFRANFAAGHEVGAAVAVYRDGVKVVDLWGGYRNGITKDPWQHDTMVNMFSTTKGVAALTVARAVSRGLFGYDDKVADHWPEFAQAGKADVTVRQLLGHQAGLCVLSPAPTTQEVADPAKLSPILAAQKPAWPPGTRHGYHAITLGWYKSELIRRTDPAGRTLGRFLADEIAGPLGLDLHIGLPDSVPRDRVAYLHHWKRAESLLHLNVMPPALFAASLNPMGLLARAGSLPRGVVPWDGDYNRDDVRALEIPSANGIGTAAAVAQLYGAAATGDPALGLTRPVLSELAAPPASPSRGRRDRVLKVDSTFSLGLSKPVPMFIFGSSDKAFGTAGFGGSFGFADPDTGIGFAYVMNRLGFHLCSDPRELAVRQAVFRDVLGVRPQT
ncbi:serine hydrolase domain-containing protein [Mycobacterium shimoidei]|uniref:serine hydrolase domain-containing protein n=1 Tax=Mycobacterium shimoidei TaxID=29313 RepID=UPI000848A9D2|nr:serine hydrolase domain-containing protein [Mycobacterium shimoidei]MCV7260600.1 beta-lactamase family protein [Mycobacterium shimoidei]ODR13748.1 EstA family serine hydrolase [Mycobacterium shimoidei]ORW76306.1 serine hydrolase [Mycobacterium shimoidei]